MKRYHKLNDFTQKVQATIRKCNSAPFKALKRDFPCGLDMQKWEAKIKYIRWNLFILKFGPFNQHLLVPHPCSACSHILLLILGLWERRRAYCEDVRVLFLAEMQRHQQFTLPAQDASWPCRGSETSPGSAHSNWGVSLQTPSSWYNFQNVGILK